MPDRRFTVVLDSGLAYEFDQKLGRTGLSQAEYVRGLIRADLSGDGLGKGGKDRGRKVIERDATVANLDKLLDEALVRKLEEDPDGFLAGLDDKTFATLVAARAPKPKGGDEELEEGYLSLSRALERLPDAADLGRDLGKAKGRIKKLEVELQLQVGVAKSLRGWLKKNCGDAVWQEIFEGVKGLEEAIADYAKDCGGRRLDVERLRVMCLRRAAGEGAESGEGGDDGEGSTDGDDD